jgi:hypothetical protein
VGAAGDLVERRVEALLTEDLAGSGEQSRAVAFGVRA